MPAVKKPQFLNSKEILCFNVLSLAVGNEMHILPKVRIADIFEQETNEEDKEFWKKFNTIAQKHVDFLVCKKQNFAPLLILRIRGEAHHEAIDHDEEEFIKELFDHAHIPLLDVSLTVLDEYKADFSEYEFHERILEVLNEENSHKV